MDILRFITAGNVNDGKSTLIGRLLYDTKNLKKDVLDSVAQNPEQANKVNLAFITDGLRAERKNNITIDVAYKYFTTPQRKYIIIDAPGHFEFTRNLVTGASGADAMIILVDAENGITEQTRRHSLVASFLQIRHIVVAINKMDAVHYQENVFNKLVNDYSLLADKLQLPPTSYIPMAALWGDNIFSESVNMPWYHGKTLMSYLESASVEHNVRPGNLRFSLQCAVDAGEMYFAGKMLSGTLKNGDAITAYPSGTAATVRSIFKGDNVVTGASSGENICVSFDGGSFKRGDMIIAREDKIACGRALTIKICWLDAEKPLLENSPYHLRINGWETQCIITRILNKTDIVSLDNYNDDVPVQVNQFAEAVIKTNDDVAFDAFDELQENGRGIIIDPDTNYTAAAFTILR